jgi:hypothetical protein
MHAFWEETLGTSPIAVMRPTASLRESQSRFGTVTSTVQVKDAVADAPAASLAVADTAKVPGKVVVPEIWLLVYVRPGGRPVIVNVYGGVPPDTPTGTFTGTPTMVVRFAPNRVGANERDSGPSLHELLGLSQLMQTCMGPGPQQ